MVKKTLLQWHWALEGPAANFDSEIAMCTLEVGMAETNCITFLKHLQTTVCNGPNSSCSSAKLEERAEPLALRS